VIHIAPEVQLDSSEMGGEGFLADVIQMGAAKQQYPMVPLRLADCFHSMVVQRFADIDTPHFGEKCISKAYDFNAHGSLPSFGPSLFHSPTGVNFLDATA
jgi:hypothetical protein